jgi:tetratricopeptide (TPR) repeat protein
MTTLRLTQTETRTGDYRVECALEASGQPRQVATSEFAFKLSQQDREDLRWYLEDYLEHAADPAPQIAARVERRMTEIGVELFKAIFESSGDARDLWATLRNRLNDTRVEILSGVREAVTLPWELLYDPKIAAPLALRAKVFVRAAHQTAQTPMLPGSSQEAIRILLVICRPGGDQDVPFRSVASRLIKALGDTSDESFQLDVLRPPTFQVLSELLRRANAAEKPYHIVHFDGHGEYVDSEEESTDAQLMSAKRPGSHGYLVFENPSLAENRQLVDGPALGSLLVEAKVPVLVLNACRSAHAETLAEPEQAAPNGADSPSVRRDDIHAKVRAFGSLAQEVVDAGVAGVVAMRYNVYVVTAAQFVADLYESLSDGLTLGEAVTLGRKQLDAQRLREISSQARPLRDWMVPIVYEAAPVTLLSKRTKKSGLHITIRADSGAPPKELSGELEKQPDAGFFGRDETLLALDRAFDTQQVVLLHALAGSGKTTTAIEFARWYHLTGGITGPVFFTSFEEKTTLSQVLNDTIGRLFAGALEESGIHWLALPDELRRKVALQILSQVPILWIWDNVETIAGFPDGADSAWTDAEQKSLAGFLRAARGTMAKFVLTSRRDERKWLGDLPVKVTMPPMPIQERVQMARALAEKRGRRITQIEDWMPLLRFTAGNPLTITVLVGQALRDGLKNKEEIQKFVAQLRDGEAVFQDEESEGRSKSLGASLSYGFKHGFSENERRQLALLHLFRGTVSATTFSLLGEPEVGDLPEVRDLDSEEIVALLNRAAEVGLLTTLSRGLFSIHPALPWFFNDLFNKYYGQAALGAAPSRADSDDPQQAAVRAFVRAIATLASFCGRHFTGGDSREASILNLEEGNLLHALQLAKANEWHELMVILMRGLHSLYDYRGQGEQWMKLVDETLPLFADLKTGMAKPGLEEGWRNLMGWRASSLRELRHFDEAGRIFEQLLKSSRLATAAYVDADREWTDEERSVIYDLGQDLFSYGTLQWESRDPSCIASLTEAFRLFEKSGNQKNLESCAFHLGHAYMDIETIRDFSKAEDWYRKSIELGDKTNLSRYASRLHELAQVYYARFAELLHKGERDLEVLNTLVQSAVKLAFEALETVPENATEQRMHIHHLLGNIYDDTGNTSQALAAYREAIRLSERRGATSAGAMYRREVARCLLKAGRLADALDYANEAVRKLQELGTGATEEIKKSQELAEYIKTLLTR